MTATINATTTAGVVITPDNSGAVALQNNGTTGLTLDASGRPLTPLRPAFNITGVSGGSSVGSNAVIIFTTATTNIGSNYSTSTGLFTAPVAGFYCFQTNVLFQNLTASTQMSLSIAVNGISGTLYNFGRIAYTANATGFSGYAWVGGSQSLYMNANDTVGVYNISGSSMSIYSGTEWCRFSGYLVG
jgi:hypothetical protein